MPTRLKRLIPKMLLKRLRTTPTTTRRLNYSHQTTASVANLDTMGFARTEKTLVRGGLWGVCVATLPPLRVATFVNVRELLSLVLVVLARPWRGRRLPRARRRRATARRGVCVLVARRVSRGSFGIG